MSAARLVAAALGGIALGAVLRRTSVRTGVTDAEAFGSLPGDAILPHPMVEWTRGVTVDAAAGDVWPWLVQQGYYRAGWYTPERVDRILNAVLFRTTLPSRPGDRIIPDHQALAVGDVIADGPDHGAYFRVLEVEPERAIVYQSIRHPWRPSPVDAEDPASLERTERRLRDEGIYLEFTWSFVLRPVTGNRTRLLVRTRANYSPAVTGLIVPLLGLFDAAYGSATLRSIARRAEAARG